MKARHAARSEVTSRVYPEFVIELVECSEEHRALLLGWRNSRVVARFMFASGEIPPSVHDAWYTRLLERVERQGWVITMDGTPVGAGFITGISPDHRRAEFGLYLAEESARGKGVGGAAVYLLSAQAFDVMGLHKLGCEALAFNSAGIATYRKAGFSEEGLLREHIYREGRWVDVHLFAMLEQQWTQHRPALAATLRDRELIA